MNYQKPRQAAANALTYLKPKKRPAENKTVSYCCSAVIILLTALLLCSCERKSALDSVPPKNQNLEMPKNISLRFSRMADQATGMTALPGLL